MGKHGCNADGRNVECRFCGAGDFADISCPAEQVCEFKQKPSVPFYWDPKCRDGMLGCKADGVHNECRFCATRPFEDIPCPGSVAPPDNSCTWPLRGEPEVPYFWDSTCKMGMLGCWADGLHAQCRFCGEGVFEKVACPSSNKTLPADTTATQPEPLLPLLQQSQELEKLPEALQKRSTAISSKASQPIDGPIESLAAAARLGKRHEDRPDGNASGFEWPLSGAPSVHGTITVLLCGLAGLLGLV